jgi:hypothetical protein
LSSAEAAPVPSAKAIIVATPQIASGCIRRIMSSRLMD